MDDAPERRESRKKRRHTGEPAEEHGSPCRDSADTGQLKPLQGINALVRMFGMGWLSNEVSDKIRAFTQEATVMVSRSCWAHVESFKTAFLKVRGRDNAAWNGNLRDSLSQIKQVRSRFAGEFEPLSEGAAWHCLWLWVHECVFNDDQLKLPNKKRRSILRSILMKELGCAHRMRAVVQRGMQDFDKPRSPSDTLDAFLAFVTHIEATAEASMDIGLRTQFKQRFGPPSRDAEERATIPSYPAGSVARTMCGRPTTPPRKLRDKRRHLEDEGGEPNHTHRHQERAVHDGNTPLWLQLGGQLSSITPSRKPLESPIEDMQPEASDEEGRGIYVSEEGFQSYIEGEHADVGDEDDHASDIDVHDVEEGSTPRPRKILYATAQHIAGESPVETDTEGAFSDDPYEGTENACDDDPDDEEGLAPTTRVEDPYWSDQRYHDQAR